MMLEVKSLSVSYGNLKIVDDVSFTLARGEWLMVVGPNGAGKSTLVSAISRGVKYSGEVLWENSNISALRPVELARRLGLLSQDHYVGYSFTVEEVVRLGRYAHSRGLLSAVPEKDSEMVESALKITGMSEFRAQSALTLSGGELQRVFLAQLFAQDPELLILDEPTNHLDLAYQKQIFELIRSWISRTGRSVISVVHDLSLARAYGDTALLMHHGKCAAHGAVADVLAPDTLDCVYGMDVRGWMLDMLGQWQ